MAPPKRTVSRSSSGKLSTRNAGFLAGSSTGCTLTFLRLGAIPACKFGFYEQFIAAYAEPQPPAAFHA